MSKKESPRLPSGKDAMARHQAHRAANTPAEALADLAHNRAMQEGRPFGEQLRGVPEIGEQLRDRGDA
jgi:hypothetical protein